VPISVSVTTMILNMCAPVERQPNLPARKQQLVFLAPTRRVRITDRPRSPAGILIGASSKLAGP
jgi:hypothetical protein